MKLGRPDFSSKLLDYVFNVSDMRKVYEPSADLDH